MRVTCARPVAVMLTTRSWEPSGESRQTVNEAALEPMPIGWNVKLIAPPAS